MGHATIQVMLKMFNGPSGPKVVPSGPKVSKWA